MYHCFPWFTNQGSEWYWISHMWMLQYVWEGGGAQVKDSAITETSNTAIFLSQKPGIQADFNDQPLKPNF